MDKTSFSFIIPVFNVENYIIQCVESIINQTYNNFEIILIDDGSTDNSGYLCDELKLRDERISVIHQPNQGSSAARNSGIAAAKNEYIIFVDSDDYWLCNDALRIIAQNIRSCDMVVWNYLKFNDGSEVKLGSFEPNKVEIHHPQEKIIQDYIYRASAWDKAIKRRLIQDSDLYFKVGEVGEDVEWCAKLLSLASSFVYLDLAIYAYRQRAGSITKLNPDKILPYVFAHLNYLKGLCNTNSIIGQNLCAYTAEQYANMLCIVGGGSGALDDKIKEIKDFAYILKYGRSKRCKIIRLFIGIFSLKITIRLLDFLKNRKNGRKFQ